MKIADKCNLVKVKNSNEKSTKIVTFLIIFIP